MKYKHDTDPRTGKYNIREIPIFETHDNKGFNCDESWLDKCVQMHEKEMKQYGFLPPVIIGHNKEGRTEPETVGFFSNLKRKGKKLYADLIQVRKKFAEDILDGAWPNRSVEVLPKSNRIVALALLGGTPPHFKDLGQMYQVETDEPHAWIKYEEGESSVDEKAVQEMINKSVGEALGQFSENLGNNLDEVLPHYMEQALKTFYEQQGNTPGVLPQTAPDHIAPTVDPAAVQQGPGPTETPTAGAAASGEFVPVPETGDQSMDTMMPAGQHPYSAEELEKALTYEQLTQYVGEQNKRVQTLENIAYAQSVKMRKQEYSQVLETLRSEGRPINVEKSLEFAMKLPDEEALKDYFEQLEQMPKTVPLESDGSERGPLGRLYKEAVEIRKDYEENRELYKRMGLTEDDVLFGKLVS